MLLQFKTGDESYHVDISPDGDDWLLKIDGREAPLQATRGKDGSWLVDTHQGRRKLWVAVQGDERLVFCDGRVHRLRLPDPEHADDEEEISGGPNLIADMPGKVVQTLVKPGDEVSEGQAVIIMESMKMETELLAAVTGVVAQVHVSSGQVVAQGDALVDIDSND
ncbi:MAG: biotin/lipoyl-binding protein [Gemmatimonadales bacterium]|nr:biotin/lipoyl-binding protein [Gemmatimonadales bacterium]